MDNYLLDYSNARDRAIVDCIRADSVEPFKAFVKEQEKQGAFPDCFELPSDEVLAISIRKMCLHCTRIEPSIKGMAVNWLLDHNYHLDM